MWGGKIPAMSTKENKIYQKYLRQAFEEHIPNEKRIKLFNEITPLLLGGKLSIEEFEHIICNLYFKKEWSGIGKRGSVIDWLMIFGADASWSKGQYEQRLRFFYESPTEFEKWWKENMVHKNPLK